jgi:hypothetical protein
MGRPAQRIPQGENETMRRLILFALLVLLCIATASTAPAQGLDGTLRVTVTDASGASVENATVKVINEATNLSVSSNASSAGTYVFPNLKIGSYSISVEKDGFKKSIQKGVTVASNQVAEAKVLLEIGSVSAVVEVEAGSDLIKTTTSELSTTIDGRITNTLPVNTLGGDVKEFAVFAPGTTTQVGGVLGSGGSIGGTRPRFNGFTIDGVDDNKIDTNGPTQPVIQESVAEFTLLTNQFSAEYGHSAGGQFNIVTKSGTNAWHGAGWEYNRNRNYNAADNQQKQSLDTGATTTLKSRFDYNRAGASAGGPIKKDKLFIYGAYEFQNEGLASSGTQVILPTANGMAQIAALNPDPAVAAYLKEFPTAPTANEHASCVAPILACVNGVPIEVGDFQSLAPAFSNQHDFTVNGDANLGKQQLRVRFLYDRLRIPDFNLTQPQPQFAGTQASDSRKAIITDTWTISSRLINELRASYSRLIGPVLAVPTAFKNFPNIAIDELNSNTGPEENAPQGYGQNVYQLVDSLTYIRGRHTFKGGVEARKYIAPTNVLQRSRGEWDYTSLNGFVNDFVPTGINGALRGAGSGFVADNYNAIYWFLQDDIKVTQRLTINAGLRYEYTGIPRDEGEQALNAISNDPALGLIFRKPKADKNNFAPRLGFAYDPTGRGKWSIRGGAGFAYDVTPNNFAINGLPPQLQTEQSPTVTCGLSNPPAWCSTFDPKNPRNPTAGQGFLQGGGLLQVNVPPATQTDARIQTSNLILDHVSPKVITWTLGVQHEFLRDTSFEVRYVGTRSLSLPVQVRLNSASAFDPRFASLGGGLTPLPTYFKASDVPGTVSAPASTLSQFENFNPPPLSVDNFLGAVTAFPASGSGIYHGVSGDFMHRFTKGIYFRTNYTYEKNIDNATNELNSSKVNPRRAQDGFNLPNERGRSALDLNHKFAVTWVYDLPTIHNGNGFLKGVANGWEWSGTYLAQSGQPVTVLSGVDSNFNGDTAGDRAVFNPNGSGLTGSGVVPVCNDGAGGATRAGGAACPSSNVVGYLASNPGARWVQAGPGALGNVGRDTVNSPGLNIWNMSIFKSTRLTERYVVEFRAETYNTFNHRNFSLGLPTNNGALDSTTNGNPQDLAYVLVTNAQFLKNKSFNGGSRNMQLGLRFVW